MRSALRIAILTAGAAILVCAQAPSSAPASAGSASFDNPWEIAPVLREIGDHAARLLPLLDKADPQSWVEKGASDTYIAQLKSSKEQAKALADGAKVLAENPERLSASLEVYFRMQSLGTMLDSLAEGLRKYQSPADAQALTAAAAENGANRERFQHYIVNLAAEREQDLQVMDQEAQRCRGILIQATPKSGRKK